MTRNQLVIAVTNHPMRDYFVFETGAPLLFISLNRRYWDAIVYLLPIARTAGVNVWQHRAPEYMHLDEEEYYDVRCTKILEWMDRLGSILAIRMLKD